ncbi:MAG: hypothetical protein IPP79_01820 [Chitinophagaceae bacterium]|nr:hypothetical protein [Chitinophagaceae bacterium]
MSQLLKLPMLVHHYLEHHEDDAGISFAEFLHKHYEEEHEHASKHNDHEKLPFKSSDLGFSQTCLVYQSPFSFEMRMEKYLPAKESIIFSTSFYSSAIRSKIWQPPKSC